VGDGVDGLVSSGPFLGLFGHDITLANHRTAADHAIDCLERQGYRVWSGPTLEGEARHTGAKLCIPSGYNALVQSGETTVSGPYHGLGGRNLELVGGWIEASTQTADWAIVSGSSDGLDGNSQAAGAFWTSSDSVDQPGLRRAMAEHNTAPWFRSADRLLAKKASVSHVGDLLILVCAEN
jgi:glycerate-2-kinase